MRSVFISIFAVVMLVGCATVPKPQELLDLEVLREGEQFQEAQEKQAELIAEAEEAYKKAVAAWEEALQQMEGAPKGSLDDLAMRVHESLGMTYGRLDRWGESEAHLREALALKQRLLGPTNRHTLGGMTSLGNALRKAGKHDEAVAMLEKSVALKRAHLPKGDPWFFNALMSLVGACHEAGRIEKGQPLAKELLQLQEQAPDGVTKSVMMAQALLYEKYEKTHDPARALRLVEPIARADDSWANLELLAKAQFATGDREAGAKTLERAIAKAPKEVHERLRKLGE